MGKVLTTASDVNCGHPPGGIQTEGSPRLTVFGNGVLTINGVQGKKVRPNACGLVANQGPPVTKKCVTAVSVSGGQARKLTIGAIPVLVEEGFSGTTDGLDKGVVQSKLAATANQTKLMAG